MSVRLGPEEQGKHHKIFMRPPFPCPHCGKIVQGNAAGGHISSCQSNPNRAAKFAAWIKAGGIAAQSPQIRKKLSETVRSRIAAGTWHHSFAKRHRYRYKGVVLFGSWELAYAVWLDRNGIEWSRPSERFVYEFEGKQRFYTPDFYLIGEETFVEVKGYAVDKDRAKWSQFPRTLRILQRDDLLGLGILIKQANSAIVDPDLISGIEPIAKHHT